MIVWLPLLAGALIIAASIPKIITQIRNPVRLLSIGDLLRDLTLIIGNCIWVLYGLSMKIYELSAVCAANATLIAVLVAQCLIYNTSRKITR